MRQEFVRFEALLSPGNIFSIPNVPVSPARKHPASDKPSLDLAIALAIGPVIFLANAKGHKEEKHRHQHKNDKKDRKKSSKTDVKAKHSHISCLFHNGQQGYFQ